MGAADLIDGIKPIDDAARDGDACLVIACDEFAAAWWTGRIWAYAPRLNPEGSPPPVVQIDFEPEYYSRQEASPSPLFRRFALVEDNGSED